MPWRRNFNFIKLDAYKEKYKRDAAEYETRLTKLNDKLTKAKDETDFYKATLLDIKQYFVCLVCKDILSGNSVKLPCRIECMAGLLDCQNTCLHCCQELSNDVDEFRKAREMDAFLSLL